MNTFALLLLVAPSVLGHGYMLMPPHRSSMWRAGFTTPANYNDMAQFCGGFYHQWEINGGKCGECGDAWDLPQPRPNEEGGTYGTGTIGQNYTMNEVITIQVNLTASHMGYFEFRICKRNAVDELTTQECLDHHLLEMADGTGTQYMIPTFDAMTHFIDVKLPQNLTCEYCTLQWHYYTGNSWGECEDGTTGMGCGPQETFRNCADIGIY
ncbi:uncharacterized protein LOC136029395 isoform X1 [Artemia franciscana]|uniref:Chitin-binding type-4 domain-containing protein n=1 Tax=Artemia franciscana TaxID=6661 RepID=A0AA88L3T9_ARTSF|nr:hypothetical protein QYM36_014736 [Artemia franciscana]